MIWVAAYLLIGAGVSTYSHATAEPSPDAPLLGKRIRTSALGFAVMMLLWPLALVPWERLGLD